MIIEKKCTNCEKVKNLALFHRKHTSPDGYAPWCAECRNNYNKQCQMKNGKKCSECGEKKARHSFYADLRINDGLRQTCKACDAKLKRRKSSYWKTDPVDYDRIIMHFGLSQTIPLKDSELINKWNNETDYILPRLSEKDKPLVSMTLPISD